MSTTFCRQTTTRISASHCVLPVRTIGPPKKFQLGGLFQQADIPCEVVLLRHTKQRSPIPWLASSVTVARASSPARFTACCRQYFLTAQTRYNAIGKVAPPQPWKLGKARVRRRKFFRKRRPAKPNAYEPGSLACVRVSMAFLWLLVEIDRQEMNPLVLARKDTFSSKRLPSTS